MFGIFGGPGIKVTEDTDTVTISGLRGNELLEDITKMWKTSVLEKHMFREANWRKLCFYKFYTIDIVYMIEKLISRPNKRLSFRIPVRTLTELLEIIKTKSWYQETLNANPTPRLDFNKLNLFNYKPLEFQREFMEYYNKTPTTHRLRGALLNGAPGCGKTFITTCTMTLAGMDKIIVVCPKNAINRAWEKDILGMFVDPPKYWLSNMTTNPDPDTKIYVYHYEALGKAYEHHKDNFKVFKYGMILDESHNLNDIKAQRTQAWIELCRLSGSTNIIHASGTPLKAMGSEAVPLMRVLDPMFTPRVEDTFKKIYGISGAKGLDILKNRLGIISYKIEKQELGLDKPIMVQKGITIPNGKDYTLSAVKSAMQKFMEERFKYYKARERQDIEFYQKCLSIHEATLRSGRDRDAFNEYKRCVRAIQNTTEYKYVPNEISYCKSYEFNVISKSLPQPDVKPFRSVCSVIKYLPLKIQGECLGNVVGRMRIDAHKAMCVNIPFLEICESTAKKTVVFTSFVDVLEDAYQQCKKQGLDPILVYAKTNANLAGMIKDFETKKHVNPLIATYDSLSTAVPLVMADTMIMINAPFRAYIQEQAISRIHRLRQDTQTTVYQLYLDTGSEPNISSRSLDIMKWSQEQVEAMTGVKSPYALSDENDNTTSSVEGLIDNIVTLEHFHNNYPTVKFNKPLDAKDRILSW